jgi:DNA-directed RNA polymerase subunit RPC12/RpoP
MLTYHCRACGHSREVPDDYVGKNAKCPKCGMKNRIEEDPVSRSTLDESEAVASPPPPPAPVRGFDWGAEVDQLRREENSRVSEERRPPPSPPPRQRKKHSRDMESIGLLTILVALLLFVAATFMNVTLDGEIVNIDKLQTRQNVILIGCAAWIVGAVYRVGGIVLRKAFFENE